MSGIMIAVISLCAIAAVCGIVLVVASKYMSVPQNEKFPAIRACLPGANCGACGFAGCDGYATALAEGTETRTNLCVPGASGAAAAVAEVMGVAAEEVVKRVAYVACNGDCEAACPSDAIHVVNGLAKVNFAKCTGCGICAKQCPKKVISLRRFVEDKVQVRCSNTQAGGVARKACAVACIGCKKCEKTCQHDAIHVVNNLDVIDHEKCVGCGECVEQCPNGVLVKF